MDFIDICSRGDIDAAKKCGSQPKHVVRAALWHMCHVGNLKVFKWLWRKKNRFTGERVFGDYQFYFKVACQNGYLTLAKFIFYSGGLPRSVAYAILGDLGATLSIRIFKWLHRLAPQRSHFLDIRFFQWQSISN
jgi:hypothetical protein